MAAGYRNVFGEERIGTALAEAGNAAVNAVLSGWVFDTTGGPTYYGILKRWAGSAWIKEPLKRWTGATWTAATLKRWTGAEWVEVDATGV